MGRIAWIFLAGLLAGPLDPLLAPAYARGHAAVHRHHSGDHSRAAVHKRVKRQQEAAKPRKFQTAASLKPRYKAIARGVGHYTTTLKTAAGPVRIHVVKADLKLADVGPVVARRHAGGGFGLERTSSMARRTGAICGINGSFFSPRNREPLDWLVVNGRWLSQSAKRPALVFKEDGTASIVAPRTARQTPILQAVGGGPTLLFNGKMQLAGWPRSMGGRAPRTAAGLTWDGKVLLMTVDGRSKASVGATIREEARYMAALGAREAINLDGGGSSTMVINRHVVNKPSDGYERSVSNGLMVFPKRAVALHLKRTPYSGYHFNRS